MVEGCVCCVSTDDMVNHDILEFKEGEVGVACEVKVGADLGRTEGKG